MAAPRTNRPAPPLGLIGVSAVVLATVVAGALKLPAGLVLWAGLLIVAVADARKPPALTGKTAGSATNGGSRPVPASAAESRALAKFEFWRAARTGFLPGRDMLPGTASEFSAVAIVAVGVALAFAFLPVSSLAFAPLSAVGAFLAVAGLAVARRRSASPGTMCPGVRADLTLKTTRSRIGAGASVLAAGVVFVGLKVAASALAAVGAAPLESTTAPRLGLTVRFAHAAATALAAMAPGFAFAAAGGALIAVFWKLALEAWRDFLNGKAEWTARWAGASIFDAPTMTARRHVGPFTVDSFTASPTSGGAKKFILEQTKLDVVKAPGSDLVLLTRPSLDATGAPDVLAAHPLEFDAVTFTEEPDLTTCEEEVAALAANVAFMKIGPALAAPIAAVGTIELATTDESPRGWRIEPVFPLGGTIAQWNELTASARLDGPPFINHRKGFAFLGASDGELLNPKLGSEIADAVEEGRWVRRWSNVLKATEQPPTPVIHVAPKPMPGPGNVPVEQMVFALRLGTEIGRFQGLEAQLRTALGKPFAAVLGNPTGGEARAFNSFRIAWMAKPAPALDRLDDCAAARLVIGGILNEAFDAVKLARPEVVSAVCVAAPTKRIGGIWDVSLALFGPVTLGDLRRKAAAVKSALGVKWLRFAELDGVIHAFVGESPTNVTFADAEIERRIETIEWEQAFVDSKLMTPAGLTPALVSVERAPANPLVRTLTFALPSGLELSAVKDARDKLSAASGHTFVEVRKGAAANEVKLIVAVENPIPSLCPPRWEQMGDGRTMPFGVGIDGGTVTIDVFKDPHVLLSGSSGSGKSSMSQSLVTGAILNKWIVVVVDPIKAGADFAYARPWCARFVGSDGVGSTKTSEDFIVDAAEAVAAVRKEVARRVRVNSANGKGRNADLPDDLRSPHVLLFIDEFNSVVKPEPVPGKSNDPTVMERRDQALELNDLKARIGAEVVAIAAQARSAGITMVLGAQKLTAAQLEKAGLSTELKTNLSRVILGKTTFGDRQAALRVAEEAPDLGDDLPKGRGIFEPTETAGVAFQGFFAPQAEHVAQLEASSIPFVDAAVLPAVKIRADKPELAPGESPAMMTWSPGAPLVVNRSAEFHVAPVDDLSARWKVLEDGSRVIDLTDADWDLDAFEDVDDDAPAESGASGSDGHIFDGIDWGDFEVVDESAPAADDEDDVPLAPFEMTDDDHDDELTFEFAVEPTATPEPIVDPFDDDDEPADSITFPAPVARTAPGRKAWAPPTQPTPVTARRSSPTRKPWTPPITTRKDTP